MKCKRCGATLRRGTKFCPNCGAPRDAGRRAKLGSWIAAACALLALLLGGAALWFAHSPACTLYEALRAGEREAVVGSFNGGAVGAGLQRRLFRALATRYIEGSYSDYCGGALTYEEARERLEPLKRLRDVELSNLAQRRTGAMVEQRASAQEYARAEELLAEEDYLDAMLHYDAVTEGSTLYRDAREHFESCRKSYIDAALKNAGETGAQEDYAEGLELLSAALERFPEDAVLKERWETTEGAYRELVRSDALASAEAQMKEGDCAAAISALKAGLRVLRDDAALTEKRGEAEAAYCEQIRAQVDRLIAEGAYDEAVGLVKPARKYFSDRSELDAMLEEIEAARSGTRAGARQEREE